MEFGAHCAPNLNWSHFRLIMRLSDKNAINYYLTEATASNWSVRTLDRNISTLYYQCLFSSQKKDLVITEMKEKTQGFQQDKLEFIKNPAIFEFLGLPIIPATSKWNWKKPSLTIFSNFFLNWVKGVWCLTLELFLGEYSHAPFVNNKHYTRLFFDHVKNTVPAVGRFMILVLTAPAYIED